LVEQAVALHRRLDGLIAPALAASVDDCRAHLDRLIRPGFVLAAGIDRLDDLDRYLRAIGRRLDRLSADVAKDRRNILHLQQLEARYRTALTAGASGPDAVEVGWLLEELRVGTFAQTLGTASPVSAARLTREIARLETSLR
jgi:ATP-dependent helicase HrpA